MNAQSQDTVTFLLTTLVSMLVVVGLAVRYVLMPYLREHLIQPVKETHEQVTVNAHESDQAPTLPDRLEDISTDVGTLTRVLDSHVQWSESEHERIDRELAESQREARRTHRWERREDRER